MHEVTLTIHNREFFGYNVLDLRKNVVMENEWSRHVQLRSVLVHFLATFLLPCSTKFFTCCTTIFFKSMCHKLHTSFILSRSRPSWPWVIVYAHTTTTKTISPTRNRTSVHCEHTTDFTQSTVDFCGIFAA